MAFALVLGLLAMPVTCALAGAPHSIFMDPASSIGTADPHAQHRAAADAPATQPAFAPSPADDKPRLNDLPEPYSVLAGMVAVLPAISLGQLPRLEQIPALGDAVPDPYVTPPDAPPPR